jgi:hypothetical protein
MLDLLILLLMMNIPELFTYLLFFDATNPIFEMPASYAACGLILLNIGVVLLQTTLNISLVPILLVRCVTHSAKAYILLKYGISLETPDIGLYIYKYMAYLTHIEAHDDSLTRVFKCITFWLGYTFGIAIPDVWLPVGYYYRHYLTGMAQYIIDNYKELFGIADTGAEAPASVETKKEIEPAVTTATVVTVSTLTVAVTILVWILLKME